MCSICLDRTANAITQSFSSSVAISLARFLHSFYSILEERKLQKIKQTEICSINKTEKEEKKETFNGGLFAVT